MIMAGMLIAVIQSVAESQEELRFRRSIKDLPLEEQCAMVKTRDEIKEKQRIERTIERRHKEMCEAIKEAGREAGKTNRWPEY